jgi:hypothetical protein
MAPGPSRMDAAASRPRTSSMLTASDEAPERTASGVHVAVCSASVLVGAVAQVDMLFALTAAARARAPSA